MSGDRAGRSDSPDESTITLRELLEQRIDALEKAWQTRIEDHRRTHEAAADSIERRLGEMNQLRHQIESERGDYVRRDTLDDKLTAATSEFRELARANAARISILENGAANLQGRIAVAAAVTGVMVTVAVTVVVIVVNLLTGTP
jgi:alkylation response protein AidB-like acyl-CoA dehydrogenase